MNAVSDKLTDIHYVLLILYDFLIIFSNDNKSNTIFTEFIILAILCNYLYMCIYMHMCVYLYICTYSGILDAEQIVGV